ncbi:hypothetical protein [Pseudooctadecabacter jejudonensis]|uniref:Glycosyltransferase RgtA/B/C/D-like domain-containing protein n=1 Tax=Pseudooctadecabacter jejudonensis TaxID=1391910 RepID=A0A1Y5SW26_9RHOB|nr:hypothetical protein [Pseudooctadecabacter jejudonensis]SLN49745.1 hypothetical protein PSJ8397_02580 [Pseudooctadecabacter jejudonensis]
MTHQNTAVLTVFCAILIVLLGGVSALQGGLFIGKHEGDTLHLMQIVFRMAEGQTPHLDFMTPIGALAFWPIAVLVKAGLGIGMAIIWAQIAAAVIFLPVVIWVARTRLSPGVGALFGLIIMVLLLALVHGEAQRSVSISMHYNRLAWAAAFVAVVMAVVPSQRPSGTLDGVIMGAMICIMAMIKMTYFVSFAVPILVAMILTKQTRAIFVAAITGLAVVAVITVMEGVGYWVAYAGDLLAVAGSDVRAAPGEPLAAIMGAPAYLGGSLAVFLSVIFLRQAGVAVGGLVLLLLIPGFFYVTYQNFGNDPQWLLLVTVVLLALRGQAADTINRFGINARDGILTMACVSFALTAPSFFNLAYSPFRHAATDTSDYVPILPRGGVHSDLYAANLRVNRVDGRIAMDGAVEGLTAFEDREDPVEIFGEIIPRCTIELGLPHVMDVIASDIDAAGLSQGPGGPRSMFAADIFSSYWLFGDLAPMAGGAPWYYGGAPGLKDAELILVPLCPVAQDVQGEIAEILNGLVEADKITVREVLRTELYVVYEKTDL